MQEKMQKKMSKMQEKHAKQMELLQSQFRTATMSQVTHSTEGNAICDDLYSTSQGTDGFTQSYRKPYTQWYYGNQIFRHPANFKPYEMKEQITLQISSELSRKMDIRTTRFETQPIKIWVTWKTIQIVEIGKMS